MFNPETNECTDKKKLTISRQCNAYKECQVIETASPFGKWVEAKCGPDEHFDPTSGECIDIKDSTCGDYSNKKKKQKREGF